MLLKSIALERGTVNYMSFRTASEMLSIIGYLKTSGRPQYSGMVKWSWPQGHDVEQHSRAELQVQTIYSSCVQ